MVPRHDIARNHHCIRAARRSRHLAHGDHRDGKARLADRADPARPDRHDDDRPRAHRATGSGRSRGRRPCAPDPVPRLRARHGAGVRRRAVDRPGLRRAQASHGAARVAGGTLGGRAARRPGQCGAALGRGHSHVGRAIARHRGARRPLSRRAHVVDDSGLVLHRAPQLHGRGQSSGAGAVGDARRHPGQWPARLCD